MIQGLTYSLKVEGDVHTGTGMGLPGLIDEFVLRDAEGTAYLPASHIKGLVRDSCYLLWQMRKEPVRICEGQKQWQSQATDPVPDAHRFCEMAEQDLCLMCALFGSPSSQGSFWFSPATYLDADTLGKLDLGESDGALRAHTAIDPYTKRAKTNQLFQIEVVQPIDLFYGDIHFTGWAGAQPELDHDSLVAWLTAALLFTRRVGGNRRRGWGHCRFTLATDDKDNLEAIQKTRIWLGEEAI